MDAVLSWPATRLLQAFRSRELSPIEYLRAIFARIEEVQPSINALGDLYKEEALNAAQEIAAKKPGSIGHTKRLLGMAFGDITAGLEAERARFVQQIATQEARQGILAFVEGRLK